MTAAQLDHEAFLAHATGIADIQAFMKDALR